MFNGPDVFTTSERSVDVLKECSPAPLLPLSLRFSLWSRYKASVGLVNFKNNPLNQASAS